MRRMAAPCVVSGFHTVKKTADRRAMERTEPHESLTAIIADDELLARDSLRIALAQDPAVTILDECANGTETVESIRRHRPDVVFLDIEMPELDGFGVIQEIGVDSMPAVVFVTAFHAHALHAFDVHAADYLLKPFDDQRLRQALVQVRRHLSLAEIGEAERRLTNILRELGRESLRSGTPGESLRGATRFTVRTEEKALIFQARDVDWFEADGNYVWLHVRKEKHRLRISLRSLIEQLDSRQFVRIHKSTVVNLDRVREVQPWFGGDYVAILNDGRQLKVSRTFAQDFLRPVQ
jgi:two-component system LytT family response regulator